MTGNETTLEDESQGVHDDAKLRTLWRFALLLSIVGWIIVLAAAPAVWVVLLIVEAAIDLPRGLLPFVEPMHHDAVLAFTKFLVLLAALCGLIAAILGAQLCFSQRSYNKLKTWILLALACFQLILSSTLILRYNYYAPGVLLPSDYHIGQQLHAHSKELEELNREMVGYWMNLGTDRDRLVLTFPPPSRIEGFSTSGGASLPDNLEPSAEKRMRWWHLMRQSGIQSASVDKDGAWYVNWSDPEGDLTRGLYYYEPGKWPARDRNPRDQIKHLGTVPAFSDPRDHLYSFASLSNGWYVFTGHRYD